LGLCAILGAGTVVAAILAGRPAGLAAGTAYWLAAGAVVAVLAGILWVAARGYGLRITTTRVIVQASFFTLFVLACFATTFSSLDRLPGLKIWLAKFFQIDPLIALATAITTHTLYKGLIWSLVILLPTLLLGRFFCSWVCPFGALHHFLGWVFNRRSVEARIESNRYRRLYRVKYYVLFAMLTAAIFGTLQIGLLDPLCLLFRSVTTAVEPVSDRAVAVLGRFMPQGALDWLRFHEGRSYFVLSWALGGLFVFLLMMNLAVPRFFCRVLCPLGALLGLLARFGLWRIERDPDKCTACNRCVLSCEGACEPQDRLRTAECVVCFNCLDDCPHDAIRFRFVPSRAGEIPGPDLDRRKAIFAAVGGVLFYPFVRASGKTTKNFSSAAIRPPGAVEELEFLERCVKCGQCMRVCPTNVLQPAWAEAGLEGLWTPVMNFRIGYCQLHCTACGHVCPTGAIQAISLDRKLGRGSFVQSGPVRIGTAHYDTGRCLPYSKGVPCVVCEEACPTSPKAIYTEPQLITVRDGIKRVREANESEVHLVEVGSGEPTSLQPDSLVGDEQGKYYLLVRHGHGLVETHRVVGNGRDVIRIDGRFAKVPEAGAEVVIQRELKVPRVDTKLCIGCGICEHVCPIVGDRRGVYVTAEGETRSRDFPDPERNRTVQL